MFDYRRKGYQPEYTEILQKLQKAQNDLFWEINQSGVRTDKQERIRPYIRKYLTDHQISLTGFTENELVERLLNDLECFSVLTPPLEDPNVEGITVNSWEDIRVTFRTGSSCKIDGFQSSKHAIDIIRRLLQSSNITIDNAVPMAEASIGNNIRITALQAPLVDEDVGVCCYIRKLHRETWKRENYLDSGFASDSELRFLELAIRYGVSMLIVGKVNSGKTTFLSYLLSTVPNEKQVVTIESGAREMDLVKRDPSNRVINNVMHLITRHSKLDEQNITQEKLVEKVLRLNGEIVSVAEMRNEEAYAAQEQSLTGVSVLSTAHAGSPRQAHKRVADLCRKRFPVDLQSAIMQACEAFPIVVFLHALPDNRRRIMEVAECITTSGKPEYRTLYHFDIEENIQNGNELKVIGRHVKKQEPSQELFEHMARYGLSKQELSDWKERK